MLSYQFHIHRGDTATGYIRADEAIRISVRGLRNNVTNRPLFISFEVTLLCTANCRHCDVGSLPNYERQLEPRDYAEYVSRLRPAVIQLSGGEPLLREDLHEIVRESRKNDGHLPYVVVVTNGSLLNEERYLQLKEAGMDRLSVSLDFPDERHDDFRRLPGLYAHLEDMIPRLAAFGYDDISLASVITKANLPHLEELATKAEDWNVGICYSAYTALRTGNEDYFISFQKDLEILRDSINELIEMKRKGFRILNSVPVLLKIYEFFRDGGLPKCGAGRRFLVVRPDGMLTPCSMYRQRAYSTQQEMLKDFCPHNQCGRCYVASRAYSDESVWSWLKEGVAIFTSG